VLATNRQTITPWSRVFCQKLIVTQLVKLYPAFVWNLKFITVLIKAHHWSVS